MSVVLKKEKGIDLLIKAYNSIQNKRGWTLTLIGNGSLKRKIIRENKNNDDIMIKDFMQPGELLNEIEKAGAFCLPSIYEPLGVVIQEFASAGLPLITSNVCGAKVFSCRTNIMAIHLKVIEYPV